MSASNPVQFGIFTVSDITEDPTTGKTLSEHERIKAMITIAKHAEEVGLDVFALGEHHNPPFVPSSPDHDARLHRRARPSASSSRTSTTLITTNDPVKIAEDFAMLQHVADGRVDLMIGRGNTGPVYPWFGKDIRQGIPLAIENYALLHRLWREDVVDWEGKFRTPLQGFTSDAPAAGWRAAVRLARLIRTPEIAEQAAYYGDGFFANNIFWPKEHYQRLIALYRQRFAHYGHGTREQAIVGLGGQVFMRQELAGRRRRVPPVLRQRARSTATARRMEDFTEQTPLTVGSPQQVIDRYAGMRDHFGDYQRQLFLMDHAGLPLKTVLEQLDILGGEVVPVLRKELAKNRPAEVPDAPTHAVARRGPRRRGAGRAARGPPYGRSRRTAVRRHERLRRHRRQREPSARLAALEGA